MDSKIELAGWQVNALCCFLIACASVFLLSSLVPEYLSTTPDSLAYLDAARNLASGRGLVETSFVLQADGQYTPLTAWPPLYPMLLSLLPAAENNILYAAFQLATMLLVLNGILLFLVMKRSLGVPLSLILSMMVLVSSGNLIISAYAWSELLFVSTLLLIVFFGQKSLEAAHHNDARRQWLYLVLLSLSLSAAFHTRYIGLVFGIVLPLVWLLSPKEGRRLLPFGSAVLLHTSLCFALMARNFMLTGDITGSGGERQASVAGFGENLIALVNTLLLYVPSNTLLLLGALIAGVALAVGFARSDDLRNGLMLFKTDEGNEKAVTVLLSLMVAIYLVALLLLRTVVAFDQIAIRFVAVIGPLMLALVFTYLAAALQENRVTWSTWVARSVAAVVVVSVVFKGLALLSTTSSNREIYGQPMFPATIDESLFQTDHTAPVFTQHVLAVLGSVNLTTDDVIIAERPEGYEFLTGLKVRRLEQGMTTESLQWLREQNIQGFLLLAADEAKRAGQQVFAYEDALLQQPVIAVRLGDE